MRFIKISCKEEEYSDLTTMLVDSLSDEELDKMVKDKSSCNIHYFWEEVTQEEYYDFHLNF
jgi:hypothetical protein